MLQVLHNEKSDYFVKKKNDWMYDLALFLKAEEHIF